MDSAPNPARTSSAEGTGVSEEVLVRIGHMTRNLHDSLRGLGFDRLLEKAASDMPDARDRLEYVARMTEQAAQRVLNATELASPLQERIHDGASELKAQWDAASAGSFSEADYRALAAKTSAFLAQGRRRQQRDQAAIAGHHDGPGLPRPDRPGHQARHQAGP
ncbi:chemotaxis regulatin CheY-phosphate phosphatase CheZ [Herbaspirillum rubrisubalbicans]|nr:chemotaxis regulatin CheY-phosphate phosphatase CheZ [Herbaspirillum rubrisubalbicans]